MKFLMSMESECLFLNAGMNFMPGSIRDMSCSTTMSSYSGANYPAISDWTFFA